MILTGDKFMLIPTVIEKSSMGERAYDIYSRLLKNRIILLSGEINDDKANIIIAELLYLDSISHDDISIYINSPGGSITSGMAIYDTMNLIKSDVSTICVGMAASMGAFLLSCGKKGKRYCLPNSEVMIHQPLGGVNGQATEIDIVAKRIINLRTKLNTILSKNTKKNLKQIEKDTDRDYYMNSKEALDYGIIDKILQSFFINCVKIYIICPIILATTLIISIYKYYNKQNEYNNLEKETSNYNLQIKEIETKKEQFELTLSSLKEEKKEKIKEYERWIKWKEEIKEKIN